MKPIAMLACCVSISTLVGGCASTKDAILPQDGPTMMEIYEQHQLGVGAGPPRRPGARGAAPAAAGAPG
jgi:hypothetical protein